MSVPPEYWQGDSGSGIHVGDEPVRFDIGNIEEPGTKDRLIATLTAADRVRALFDRSTLDMHGVEACAVVAKDMDKPVGPDNQHCVSLDKLGNDKILISDFYPAQIVVVTNTAAEDRYVSVVGSGATLRLNYVGYESADPVVKLGPGESATLRLTPRLYNYILPRIFVIASKSPFDADTIAFPSPLEVDDECNDGTTTTACVPKLTGLSVNDDLAVRMFQISAIGYGRRRSATVSVEIRPTGSGHAYEVRGRGELQLAILIEQMRREGFEMTVSRPEVILREEDGAVLEPYERITVDIPPDFIGAVQGALAGRKGRLDQMTTDADGRVRLEYVLPVRGLIGYRGELLTDTRGTALLHQIGEGYGPWAGEVTHRTSGVLVADRTGVSNAYALFNLQERSELFIDAGVEVYEGMIVGENSRSGDMDVNPTKEKKLTNIRTHAHDEALRLTPPRPLTLEAALEFIAGDELLEVTPSSIRLRKRLLARHDRERERSRADDLRRAPAG